MGWGRRNGGGGAGEMGGGGGQEKWGGGGEKKQNPVDSAEVAGQLECSAHSSETDLLAITQAGRIHCT